MIRKPMAGMALLFLIGLAAALPLAPTPDWSAESNQVNATYGFCSSAGDVNGDGFDDVIVGASGFDNAQSNAGRVFVYHGSVNGPSLTPNWTAESNQANAYFGTSVSSAGDVNGDGYSDVIVGAPGLNNGQANEGGAFVYYGSATGLSSTPNWSTESNQGNASFGVSVSTAGDVNNDGYSDVIVGSSGFSNGQLYEGRVFVYYGSAAGLSSTPNWTAESNQTYASFGYSVSEAGDVNADGYGDVVIGSFLYDNGQTNEGRAYVYHGSANGLSAAPNWTAESDTANAQFGTSVSTAGDVNADGYDDVIIGAPYFNNGQVEGRAFVYHGSATGLSTTENWMAESGQVGVEFGTSVSTAGDRNNDGFSDVIVGASHYSNGQVNEGAAFLYHGSVSGLSNTPNFTVESDQGEAWFGLPVSDAGDVNGDGIDDVVIGAFFFDQGQVDEGSVFLYYGNANSNGSTPPGGTPPPGGTGPPGGNPPPTSPSPGGSSGSGSSDGFCSASSIQKNGSIQVALLILIPFCFLLKGARNHLRPKSYKNDRIQ